MNGIVLYRIARQLYLWRVPLLPQLIKWLIFLMYNSVIPPECKIGKDSSLVHGGIGIVIHPDAVIGDRVCIGQGMTIGGTFGSGVPIIESDVWIGPGVRILGDVRVHSNSVIGANSVVTKDVPANCIVAGMPAKTIRTIEPGSLDVLSGRLNH